MYVCRIGDAMHAVQELKLGAIIIIIADMEFKNINIEILLRHVLTFQISYKITLQFINFMNNYLT